MMRASSSEASPGSRAAVAADGPSAAVVVGAVAATAGSVVGAAVLAAAASLHWPAVVPVAGAPAPAAAGASVVPAVAVRATAPAVAGVSGRFERYPCWEQEHAESAEARWDELLYWAEVHWSRAAHLQHDWQEAGCRGLQPVWLVLRRGLEMLPA